ncbi:aminotransferase class V-fold PLP-dependent enzyme [Chelatococcus asaccharovorans]|uniref:Selenocysteine lyase/cysteine desulfurase n=1 Tax=Chelatococcus asaccharovorans TaxID=28210 RepID=A0A2V3U0F1_9HYPH|nr:aminotransferase class V-fold PLP-dependent enzyme [Chelatococcus asaccharovorans]MBS7707731.1 aminotransferase class V-fold PLP-dependent enzyme [Chelatococcus asaccharovorans]PXW55308.1 selenocysteine lyase/cysteine desulfurase [Chelatococcus asaccharovorans]
MNLAEARSDFPIVYRRAYLNACSLMPLSNRVVGAVHAQLGDLQLNGRNNSPHRIRFAEEHIRPAIARLIGASAAEIAFVKNTTEGLNIVANSIDWREGDNVVIANIEYPSNVYCWLNLQRRGVQIRWVDAKAAGGRVLVDDIAQLIDSRTRLVSVSCVQFSTGYRQDMEATGALCHERGVLLNYDAIQAAGVLDIDATRTHFDFMSAGGHKWLGGPMGTGFFYCRSSALGHLHPHAIGPGSMTNEETDIDYDIGLMQPDARRFEEALPNYPGLWGLQASLSTILALGTKLTEAHAMALVAHAIEGLKRKGYLIHSPSEPAARSGILTFRHPGLPSAELNERLVLAGVDVTVRQGNLRIAPHFYNDTGDIDRLLDALPA